MAIKWTTASIVIQRVKGSSLPTTQEIENMISEAEAFIMAAVRENLYTSITFDNEKHGILRECATNIACAKVVAENPANYASTSEASLAADIFWALAQRDLKILEDQKTITYLKGL